MFLCTYAYMFIWQWTGEHNSKRVREQYLQAVLRQEVSECWMPLIRLPTLTNSARERSRRVSKPTAIWFKKA